MAEAVTTTNPLEAIANLPPEEQKLCQAVALWLNGYSIQRSARTADCPYTTLWERIQKLGPIADDRTKFAGVVELQAMEIASEGHRLLREKLFEGGEKLSAAELNMIWGTAVDKVTRLQQITNQSHDGVALESILEKLGAALSGKRLGLTIEDLPPDQQTIDVTPS